MSNAPARHARQGQTHRLDRVSSSTLRHWDQTNAPNRSQLKSNAVVDMGWGRLIFGCTFDDNNELARVLCDESSGRRDIAFYLSDPHVVLAMAPDRLFLDPSHTFRMWLHQYRAGAQRPRGFVIRRIRSIEDAREVNRIYAARHMVGCDPQFMLNQHTDRLRSYFVAQSLATEEIVGTVTGVDHREAFNDPENGASLWCLAVDPQCPLPGVGACMVRYLLEHFLARGCAYVDLSVMHDNTEAIRLYEKLGFRRVPVFCVKHKNPINEPLFIPPQPTTQLNPYAQIIVDEARRRGIVVTLIDAEAGYFNLHFGGRSITCRESLSELTTAVAMSRCDDKRVTRRLLADAGIHVPDQQKVGDGEANEAFLKQHGSIVVKPARGEQGAGITVDVRTAGALQAAIDEARTVCEDVILEQFCEGEDLRVIVIDGQVVAAAIRKPAEVTGDGAHTIEQLIEKYSRRRMAATGGESNVPMDEQTRRCVEDAGYAMSDILPPGSVLRVRKTANLHTGGTIHDVTRYLHQTLAKACVEAARAIDIPVTGLDLLVKDVREPEYMMIEANERPGLANHEPQPTAERFIDFLFPQTVKR